MTQFNIHNSKIEQVNASGNNYKLVSDSGNNAVLEKGNIVQTTGTQNRVQVDHKDGLWAMLWEKIKGLWKWIVGLR
jgi:hypothetical protein